MSLQDYAYLAETLGPILIIASLIYVGRQLHQNTLQMKVGVTSERLQVFIQFWHRIAHDREFAALWHKGGDEYSDLDPIDQLRLQSFETSGLMVWSHLFELREANLLPDNQWREQLEDIQAVAKREAMRKAWASNQHRFSESFQKFLAQYIE